MIGKHYLMNNLTKLNYSVGAKLRDKNTGELATVTQITERGFVYEWDNIQSFIPRMGLSFIGGEVYLDECPKYGYEQFELIGQMEFRFE